MAKNLQSVAFVALVVAAVLFLVAMQQERKEEGKVREK